MRISASAFLSGVSLCAAIGCGSSDSTPTSPTTTTSTTTVTTVASDLTFIPDAGQRVALGSNPAAGVDSSGRVYLYYQDRSTNQQVVASASDGLSFGAGSTYTEANHAFDSRRTQLPDGNWRLYQYSPGTGVLTSLYSTNGTSFSAESGTRYTPVAADHGTFGVYEAFTEGSQVVLVYLGDLPGNNNLRRAVSTDNGATFTFDRGNVLGDDGGGSGNAYVDPKTIKLPDGRRRLFVMRRGTEVDSFISSDGGSTFTLESGTRLTITDFTAQTITTLNDPVVVRLTDGRYRMYVAAFRPSTNQFAIVSATTASSGIRHFR